MGISDITGVVLGDELGIPVTTTGPVGERAGECMGVATWVAGGAGGEKSGALLGFGGICVGETETGEAEGLTAGLWFGDLRSGSGTDGGSFGERTGPGRTVGVGSGGISETDCSGES